ncbi:hypothetical protein D3C77_332700 [compost metagenome]
MKSIREKFEEIWPVPDVIFWSQDIGRYAAMPDEVLQYERLNEQWAHEHNARLDTFTRCQEKTSIHLGLIDELVMDLQTRFDYYSDDANDQKSALLLNRAKQLLEQSK